MMRKSCTLALLLVVCFTTSYAQPPAGYYNAATGKTCADLKTTLKTIISTGFNQRSYADLWDQYPITDIKPREVGSGSTNVIWDIYSDNPMGTDPYNFRPINDQCGTYSAEADCYNREHSVPQSWFGSATGPSSDYLHIFPTDGYVNNRRGNYPYGEVATASWTSLNGSKLGSSALAGISGNVFEPIDSFKGDVARAFFYFVTRYESNMPSWGNNSEAADAFEPNTFPSIDIPYLQMMIRWNALDPVSAKELTRNNGAYSFQHNRNPYIDHPEYVDLVWNAACPGLSGLPVHLISFGGKLNGNMVELKWAVENEISFDHYEIQRSINGDYYTTIAQVKAINAKGYSYNDDVDNNRGRRLYYRLKKVDKDGKYSYSDVFSLHIPLNTRFTIYPNPATTYFQLQFNKTVSGVVDIRVSDMTGKTMIRRTVEAGGQNIVIPTTELSAGTYLVTVKYGGEQYMQKVNVVK